jgi:hypothetical protein
MHMHTHTTGRGESKLSARDTHSRGTAAVRLPVGKQQVQCVCGSTFGMLLQPHRAGEGVEAATVHAPAEQPACVCFYMPPLDLQPLPCYDPVPVVTLASVSDWPGPTGLATQNSIQLDSLANNAVKPAAVPKPPVPTNPASWHAGLVGLSITLMRVIDKLC